MVYEEFNDYIELENKEFPFAKKYGLDDCVFYVEPMFYSQLFGMKTFRPEEFSRIMDSIKATILKYKKVIFTEDFENPYVDLEDFIYREIHDITDPLQIFVEDKSRGSDYGD